ncbi:TPA: coat protein, partial [Clostridioides difficile]|nr:coat protein [Clostridioides difficile]
MAVTKLSDVIVPELFNPYVINKSMELSALYQSGIITNDASLNALASQAAPVVNMPFFEDLSGESEQIIEDADLTPNKITSSQDAAAILRRAKMWAATDLSAAMAGKDPMAAIASLVGSFWARDMQKELIAVLNGVFLAANMTTNKLDISAGTGNAAKWSPSAFIDAQQLLGDAQGQLKAIAMHSATKSALKKQNLIETIRPDVGPDFEVYQDKLVIVDDGCPVSKEGVYTSYLFGSGAIALGNGNPVGFVATEIDRDKKKGSGVD